MYFSRGQISGWVTPSCSLSSLSPKTVTYVQPLPMLFLASLIIFLDECVDQESSIDDRPLAKGMSLGLLIKKKSRRDWLRVVEGTQALNFGFFAPFHPITPPLPPAFFTPIACNDAAWERKKTQSSVQYPPLLGVILFFSVQGQKSTLAITGQPPWSMGSFPPSN
jgi:hypothetical protein